MLNYVRDMRPAYGPPVFNWRFVSGCSVVFASFNVICD